MKIKQFTMTDFYALRKAKDYAIGVILRAREITKNFTPEMEKDMKTIREHYAKVLRGANMLDCLILSELRDFDCFYTRDFREATELLSCYAVTIDEIKAVYRKYYQTEGCEYKQKHYQK